jgi:hypothetical protein
MATLPVADQTRISTGLMRHWSRLREQTTVFTKANLLAAVQATDTWIDSNQTSFNNSLPAQFRNSATTAQKTLLFMCVAAARVSMAFLRMIVGEVD